MKFKIIFLAALASFAHAFSDMSISRTSSTEINDTDTTMSGHHRRAVPPLIVQSDYKKYKNPIQKAMMNCKYLASNAARAAPAGSSAGRSDKLFELFK